MATTQPPDLVYVAGVPTNQHGQPVGEEVTGWVPREGVRPVVLEGRTVRVEPLTRDHLDDLWSTVGQGTPASAWTYLPAEPPATREAFGDYLDQVLAGPWVPFAVVVAENGVSRAVGHECLMRDDPAHGVVEVGYVLLSSTLQRSTSATEASYLLMRHVFEDLGYRRYEWKCDALNSASRRAAERLGFRYEGTFAQHKVIKGRSRDTAWFAITDEQWPTVRDALERWLDPANFDADGRQRAALTPWALGPDAGTRGTLP